MRRYAEAEKEFRAALALTPDDDHCHRMRAWCLFHTGRHEEARAAAAEAVQLHPDAAINHFPLASSLVELTKSPGWPGVAEKAVMETLRLAPDWADAFALLALLRWRERRWNDMLDATTQALAIEPENSCALFYRTQALLCLGNVKAAEETVQQLMAAEPEWSQSHLMLALVRQAQRRDAECTGSLQEALRLDPNDLSAHWLKESQYRTVTPTMALLLRELHRSSRWDWLRRWMARLEAFGPCKSTLIPLGFLCLLSVLKARHSSTSSPSQQIDGWYILAFLFVFIGVVIGIVSALEKLHEFRARQARKSAEARK